MIQIMQQLQIENQAIMRALSEQQEQLNQQQEASHQQMRRLEAMIVNIAQQSSGAVLHYEHQAERAQGVIAEALPAVLQDEHLAEEEQDVIVGTLPLFALTDSPTDKAYSPADEEETYQEWMEFEPTYEPTDDESVTLATAPAGEAHSPTAEETDVQRRQRERLADAKWLADARARNLTSQSTPGNVVQRTAAKELERLSRAAARSRPTDSIMTHFTQEQRDRILAEAEQHRQSVRKPNDRRFIADLEAGRPYKMAKAKLRSRLRAAARRWYRQPERVTKDLALNKLWAEDHDHSLEGSKVEGGDAFVDKHERHFEGDEGLEPNLERIPYERKDLRKHLTEAKEPVLRNSDMRARSWDMPKHMKPQSAEAKTNANKKRAARRKAYNIVQATAEPKWHAAKRETLPRDEQAADKAKRPRTTSKFPLAPWARASSSSGSTGPMPPVFGPPPEPPPGRERTRSPEESAGFDDRAILDRIRFIQRKNLWRELENVKTRKEADVLAKKISALEAELYKDDVVFEGYALAKEFAKAGEPTPAWQCPRGG